ncbi:hypothetical protein [Marinicauda sp. Alg238-R41]|uniref:hypothetical protein n=1 Tax=Marinicauda sp. Alg238-R41 TaxID=2993447 RepID=UPI0022E3C4F3|nr:hypothetical protein [Marinicauda sp. Alg238-R41]
MPSYIDTASLLALSENELLALWRTIADEMEWMPEGSEARAEAEALIGRIRAAIIRKRQMNRPSGPIF